DPSDFYKKLLADPETVQFMKTLYNKVQAYGEDKDKFLNYMVGSIASWYTSMEMMVANVETVKLLMLLNSIEQGMMLFQDTLRESHKSEAAKPV
ncbi:unnamed protein product, partial [marine sediment metagenome]